MKKTGNPRLENLCHSIASEISSNRPIIPLRGLRGILGAYGAKVSTPVLYAVDLGSTPSKPVQNVFWNTKFLEIRRNAEYKCKIINCIEIFQNTLCIFDLVTSKEALSNQNSFFSILFFS